VAGAHHRNWEQADDRPTEIVEWERLQNENATLRTENMKLRAVLRTTARVQANLGQYVLDA
jgi:DNA anti-recombination protein RmuC